MQLVSLHDQVKKKEKKKLEDQVEGHEKKKLLDQVVAFQKQVLQSKKTNCVEV